VVDGIRRHPSDLILPETPPDEPTKPDKPASQPAGPASDSVSPPRTQQSVAHLQETLGIGREPYPPARVSVSFQPRILSRCTSRENGQGREPHWTITTQPPAPSPSIHPSRRSILQIDPPSHFQKRTPSTSTSNPSQPGEEPNTKHLQRPSHHHPSRPSQLPEFFHHPRGWNPVERAKCAGKPAPLFTTPTSILAEVMSCASLNPASRLAGLARADLPTLSHYAQRPKRVFYVCVRVCVCVPPCPNTRIPEWR
jgi:hypothetical protein